MRAWNTLRSLSSLRSTSFRLPESPSKTHHYQHRETDGTGSVSVSADTQGPSIGISIEWYRSTVSIITPSTNSQYRVRMNRPRIRCWNHLTGSLHTPMFTDDSESPRARGGREGGVRRARGGREEGVRRARGGHEEGARGARGGREANRRE